MKPPSIEQSPTSGLWAYHKGKFYALAFCATNRKMDHVTWFRSLELPDYGPPFDRIVRGRMMWDWHFDHYVLTFYGFRRLPNQIYQLVNRHFNPSGEKVVERPAAENWT